MLSLLGVCRAALSEADAGTLQYCYISKHARVLSFAIYTPTTIFEGGWAATLGCLVVQRVIRAASESSSDSPDAASSTHSRRSWLSCATSSSHAFDSVVVGASRLPIDRSIGRNHEYCPGTCGYTRRRQSPALGPTTAPRGTSRRASSPHHRFSTDTSS
jgi:hypothetical protein